LHPDNEEALGSRVVRAAEDALAHHQYVSALDVLTGMGLLTLTNLEAWRKGRIDFLERVIQGNLKKISFSMAMFRRWAQARRLRPSETRYVRRTRMGTVDLQFSKSGDPAIEKSYRTHYVSPALSEHKQQQIKERLSWAAQRVVFQILRDSKCSECGAELAPDSFLFMEAEQPLCLHCARLGALTRRAAKYSGRTAVVVRFSKSRGRYERQGILVENAALERAERECTLDADARATARVRAAALRREQDRELIARMTRQMLILFPGCPPDEASEIARHTAARGSGRIGRTAAGRNLEEQALTVAVSAAVRHQHTKYDALLAAGLDRALARQTGCRSGASDSGGVENVTRRCLFTLFPRSTERPLPATYFFSAARR
jgi:hypothetical protein